MFITDGPIAAERRVVHYDLPFVLPMMKKKSLPHLALLRGEERHSRSVPLGRLYEKMKNKRSKYLIGDLMQLSS